MPFYATSSRCSRKRKWHCPEAANPELRPKQIHDRLFRFFNEHIIAECIEFCHPKPNSCLRNSTYWRTVRSAGVEGKSKAARRLLPMAPTVYRLLKARYEAQGSPIEGTIFRVSQRQAD